MHGIKSDSTMNDFRKIKCDTCMVVRTNMDVNVNTCT